MIVLGIESTCDETACALVRSGNQILSNVVSSQIDLHTSFGGVVPELSCRRHVEVIIPVIDQALKEAQLSLSDVDLIAVAHGPGLVGPLLIGVNVAKTLSIALNKPFIGVNHTEAHLFAALMSQKQEPIFPCLGVVLSGGHTNLVKMRAIGDYSPISETVDDAIGEAFDKVAKMLDLPYPGGPPIEKLAKQGDLKRFPLKAGQVKKKPLHFSFSGLKTGALYTTQKPDFSEEDAPDLAASFQHAAFRDIIKKALKAAEANGCKTLVFGGGVTNNQYLRALFEKKALDYTLLWPTAELTLDNAAMIAGLGYHRFLQKNQGDSLDLEAMTRMSF